MTVLGPVEAHEIGLSLSHEHLFVDLRTAWFREPQDLDDKRLAYEPLRMDNLWYHRRNPFNSFYNLVLDDTDELIGELVKYKIEGGKTVFDATTKGLNPNPLVVKKIAAHTGLNIVLGAGYYVGRSHPPGTAEKTVEELVREIENDIFEGFDGSGVRAGFIGEIGTSATEFGSETIPKNEIKVLKAAARAQASTGVALMIHPPRAKDRDHPSSWWSLQILDIVRDEGANLNRVIMCHNDRTIFERLDLQKEMARRGAYVEYDLWGTEQYFRDWKSTTPSDFERVISIKKLAEEGYLNRLLISQDVCKKTQLSRYGGHGYFHILRNIVPMLRDEGFTDGQIRTITEENPKRAFKIE